MKVEDRLNDIERELAEMKTRFYPRKSPRVIKLKGSLKGLHVDRSDLEKARKSLFKHARS